MRLPIGIVSAVMFATFVVGCNPSGTCIIEDSPTAEGECIVNYNQKPCDHVNRTTHFFSEGSVEGVLRCKSAGYETSTDKSPPNAKEPRHFRKPKPKS